MMEAVTCRRSCLSSNNLEGCRGQTGAAAARCLQKINDSCAPCEEARKKCNDENGFSDSLNSVYNPRWVPSIPCLTPYEKQKRTWTSFEKWLHRFTDHIRMWFKYILAQLNKKQIRVQLSTLRRFFTAFAHQINIFLAQLISMDTP